MRVYRCKSWEEYIVNVRDGRWAIGRLFRGHEKTEWKLSSHWERFLDRMRGHDRARDIANIFAEGAFEKIRDIKLRAFKELVVGLPGFDTTKIEKDEDWWALGRHFGLLTPLLDWTHSPYVAAFFAFADRAERCNPGFKEGTSEGGTTTGSSDPIAIWSLAVHESIVGESAFRMVRSRVDQAQRQRAQRGVFTWLTHSLHLDVEAYLLSMKLGAYLERYEIPGSEWCKALSDLQLMNITFATLFPDLHGAAMQANTGGTVWQLGKMSYGPSKDVRIEHHSDSAR